MAQAVPEGASLFVGIRTTAEECAAALQQRQQLGVMTNNLNVVATLRRNPGCELVIAGGRLRNDDNDVVAGEAHEFFARCAADIGIYGVGGVAEDDSLLDFSQDEVRMRSELSQHCRQRYLVLDHFKFGRSATVRGGHITEAQRVFTDRPVPATIAAMLLDAGEQRVVASASTCPPLALTEGEH